MKVQGCGEEEEEEAHQLWITVRLLGAKCRMEVQVGENRMKPAKHLDGGTLHPTLENLVTQANPTESIVAL